MNTGYTEYSLYIILFRKFTFFSKLGKFIKSKYTTLSKNTDKVNPIKSIVLNS